MSSSCTQSRFARLGFRRFFGGSTAEMLVCTVGFLIFSLGAIQVALNYKTKALVNSATFQAARIGAVSHGEKEPMKIELARQLTMMYGSTAAADIAKSYIHAIEDLNKPLLPNASSGAGLKIDIINPTSEAFRDFGVEVDGKVQIPNSHLKARSREIGETSGVNIQDANLLKIKVTYGYRMYVPIASQMIAKILTVADPEHAAYYKAIPPRLPIESTAIVRMQSPAYEDGNWSRDGHTQDEEETSGAVPLQAAEGDSDPADSDTVESESSDSYYGDDSDVLGRGGNGDSDSNYFGDYTNTGNSDFADSVANQPGLGSSYCDTTVSNTGLSPAGNTRNPVKIITGNKMYPELDYQAAGAFPLTFRRNYITIIFAYG